MAIGFPTKANWAAGDVLTASALDDLAGTVNTLSTASSSAGQVQTSGGANASVVYKSAGVVGGMQLISRVSFSNVASQIFDNVFTSSFKGYYINFENFSAVTASDDIQMQLRVGSSTITSGAYYGASYGVAYNSATFLTSIYSGASQFTIWTDSGNAANPSQLSFTYTNTTAPGWSGTGQVSSTATTFTCGGNISGSNSYTGFLVKSSSSNISGTIAIYGLAMA
jgi:hypothetical protein